jgi:hypothetical protein
MSLETRSVPSGCKSCGSECVYPDMMTGEMIICHDCGELSEIEDPRELTAHVMKCPHCESIDAICAYGGEEVCQICGCDPNEEDPDIATLAHLWKARTPEMDEDEKLIREIMSISNSNGEPRFAASSGVGNFLRTLCGPHCSFANECEQTTKNLSRCYREEREPEEDDMSKRHRKGKNKVEKARRKEERKLWNQLHARAWLFTPPKGWFVSKQNYEPETIYQEQSES